MQGDKLLLSVVTVTYNAKNTIISTLESILNQRSYENKLNIELIVVDGKSTDDTVEIVESIKDSFDRKNISLHIVSEPDDGIYFAMNKGIKIARGDWVYLLNSGDYFYDSLVLCDLIDYFFNPSYSIICGGYCRKNRYIEERIKVAELKNLKTGMVYCHQAIFVRKEIYEKKCYDTKYRLDADYFFIASCYLDGINLITVDRCIVVYDLAGETAKNMLEAYKESYEIRKNLGVITNAKANYLRYLIGCLKRRILALFPQYLRWYIYKIHKGKNIKKWDSKRI